MVVVGNPNNTMTDYSQAYHRWVIANERHISTNTKEHRSNMTGKLLTSCGGLTPANSQLLPSHSLTSTTQWDRELTLKHLSFPFSQAQFHSFTPSSSTHTQSSRNEAHLAEGVPAAPLLPKSWHLHPMYSSMAREQSPCTRCFQVCHWSPLYSMVWE